MFPLRRLLPVAAVALGALACTPPPPPPPPPGAPTLTVTPVASNLNRPWDIAFAPDGTMLFTEKVGRIAAWIGGAKVVVTQPADAVVAGESGMMGLALDPAFASNRRAYVCFLSDAGGSLDIRVARFDIGAGYASATNRVDLVTGIPVNTTGQAGRHGGCRVRFGPDGFLWVSTGDAATNTHPQSPTSLGGKVLRITTSGAGAPGNPGGALDPRIYTLGHRNPQGLAFRADGTPFAVEHGPAVDDEVNRLVPGGNYGWYPVPLGGGSFYDESRPMTDPVRVPGARAAVWSSGFPTIAPSGATFLSGAQWQAWNGALAIAVLKGAQLLVLQLDAPGDAVTASWTAVTDQGRLRSAVQGPDGSLYLATDADPGRILRVTPS